MDGLVGSVIPALERSMRFRVARQGVLAANLANIDTPRYRRQDLSFDAEVGRAARSMRSTHPRHVGDPGQDDYRIHTAPRSDRPDGNGVELQREVVEASRNAGAFKDQAAVISRLLVMRRIAVTGEPR
ncbi:MAG: flagellar basal body rod protein FlgB [Myxococcota bacterium]|nr:flagellar basal body rod protein FlgB [Myxococcota bacterium]